MGRPTTTRPAAAATGGLGLLLAWAAASPPPVRHAPLLLGVLAAVALTAAVRLGLAGCMESRVAAVAVATLAAAGVALTSTIGLPGAGPRPIDAPAVTLLLTALSVVGLVHAVEPTRSADADPYAS